jgi:hypothetical protein
MIYQTLAKVFLICSDAHSIVVPAKAGIAATDQLTPDYATLHPGYDDYDD